VHRLTASLFAIVSLGLALPPAAARAQSPAPPPANGPLPRKVPMPLPPGPAPNSQYRLGPDSLPQEGVPKGEIRGPFVIQSKVFPGTQHTYWVYVPAQYDRSKPTDLMVFQDGAMLIDPNGDVRAPNVLDNLIYRRELPVMIAVFINPGRRPDQIEPGPTTGGGDGTTNRDIEYNTPDDKYAHVVTDELLPVIYKDYNISRDANDHGIGGSSSGAIAAFGVAWARPDVFSKVLSNVGSFVNMRGGNVFADRVLASDRKPLRVFLADGRNDNRGPHHNAWDEELDWFYQNVRMMKALTQKGYDVNYSWSVNTHGGKYMGVIFPDMMRWLWRDAVPVSVDPTDMADRGLLQPAAGQ